MTSRELLPLYPSNSIYFNPQGYDELCQRGYELADRLESGQTEGFPDNALQFLRDQTVLFHTPAFGQFRLQMAETLDESDPTNPHIVRTIGSAIHGLIVAANDYIGDIRREESRALKMWS